MASTNHVAPRGMPLVESQPPAPPGGATTAHQPSFAYTTTVVITHSNSKVASDFLTALGLKGEVQGLQKALATCLGPGVAPDFYDTYDSFSRMMTSKSSVIFHEKPNEASPNDQVYALYNDRDTLIQDVRDLRAKAKKAARGAYRRYWVMWMPFRFRVSLSLSGVLFKIEPRSRVALSASRAYLLAFSAFVGWVSSMGSTGVQAAASNLLLYLLASTGLYAGWLVFGLISRRYFIELNKPA